MESAPSFHGLRKERLAQWPPFCILNTTKDSGEGVLTEKLGEGVRHASYNPYPISDLIKNLIPSVSYLKPWSPARDKLYTVVGVSIKRKMVFL